MNSFPNRPTNRRGFFITAARSAAVLALAAFAAWQETKRRRLTNDPNCIKLSVCSDCVEFGHCTKPKAQAARQSSPRGRGVRLIQKSWPVRVSNRPGFLFSRSSE